MFENNNMKGIRKLIPAKSLNKLSNPSISREDLKVSRDKSVLNLMILKG